MPRDFVNPDPAIPLLTMPASRLVLSALAALTIALLPQVKADCCFRFFLNCIPDLYACGDCTPVQGDWCGEGSCFLG